MILRFMIRVPLVSSSKDNLQVSGSFYDLRFTDKPYEMLLVVELLTHHLRNKNMYKTFRHYQLSWNEICVKMKGRFKMGNTYVRQYYYVKAQFPSYLVTM